MFEEERANPKHPMNDERISKLIMRLSDVIMEEHPATAVAAMIKVLTASYSTLTITKTETSVREGLRAIHEDMEGMVTAVRKEMLKRGIPVGGEEAAVIGRAPSWLGGS